MQESANPPVEAIVDCVVHVCHNIAFASQPQVKVCDERTLKDLRASVRKAQLEKGVPVQYDGDDVFGFTHDKMVYVLDHLRREQYVLTVAHELAHLLQGQEQQCYEYDGKEIVPIQPLMVREGFAQWVAFQVVQTLLKAKPEMVESLFTGYEGSVYGDGLALLQIAEKFLLSKGRNATEQIINTVSEAHFSKSLKIWMAVTTGSDKGLRGRLLDSYQSRISATMDVCGKFLHLAPDSSLIKEWNEDLQLVAAMRDKL